MAEHSGTGRIGALDMARTLALVCMAVFHFTVDLEMFSYIPQGTTTSGGWAVFARLIAGSFIFLAGVSLFLAHGGGVRWLAAGKRLLKIAMAAALVTLATRLALPQGVIFYGILHSIFVSSLIGLLFLRTHEAVTIAVAAAVWALPYVYRSEVFDAPWLVWTGLAERVPFTMDFEPLFPWLAPLLFGVAFAKLAARSGLWDRLRSRPASGRLAAWLGWPGQHSLAVYLIHQPVLIAVVYVYTVYL
jgi:uncharacterized membrane protein